MAALSSGRSSCGADAAKQAVAVRPPLAVAPFDADQARAHQKEWAESLRLPVLAANSVGMRLVFIPPGDFSMGSTPQEIRWCIGYMTQRYIPASHELLREKFQSEGPARRVRIDTPFYLGVGEVTRAQYAAVMKGEKPNENLLPVDGLSWLEAAEFCKRLSALPAEKAARRSYRLPSEAEWEYACRAGNAAMNHGYDYWYASNSKGDNKRPSVHPVGAWKANPWGLYDMLGNVAEWCANQSIANAFNQFPRNDGPENAPRAFRGGSCFDASLSCRPAWSDSAPPDKKAPGRGLRVCASVDLDTDTVAAWEAVKPAAGAPNAPSCDPVTGICAVPIPPQGTSVADKTPAWLQKGMEDRLTFKLADAYGREIRHEDFRGAPVLILLGACWCGGCQQDADYLRGVERRFRDRGLQTIRCTVWDNELPAWEFVKHYRLPSVPLQDPDRQFEMRFHRGGWTFLMLADAEGKIVRRDTGRVDWPAIEQKIDEMLPKKGATRRMERDGVLYPPAVLERSGETARARPRDVYPSLACTADGRRYVAFTSNRGGTQDVFLRVFDGQRWLPDRPVAATNADEFDGCVFVDRQNRVWVSWTSNVEGPHYDIYVAQVSDRSTPIKPVRITQSDDDAMHARMAADAQGRIWVTYYKWAKMGPRSRDKEVYARFIDAKAKADDWSQEIHISPEDVPQYEDHTDPFAVPQGNAMVFGWSWDFHQPQGYSRVPDTPTIFLRKRGPDGALGRARPISARNTDSRPTLAVGPDGRIGCAWESADRRTLKKSICASVVDLEQPEKPNDGVNLSGLRENVCTPCLAAGPQGQFVLVWAEVDAQGQWSLRQAACDAGKTAWSTAQTIAEKANPRWPSAAFAADGTLWVAYSAEKEGGRSIEVLAPTAPVNAAATAAK